jgi:hypothetical protein
MLAKTIGAPLWVSGDRKRRSKHRREVNWLDTVSSALDRVHSREMIARVILGGQKFINTEAPRVIAGLQCFNCKTPFENLRSFKWNTTISLTRNQLWRIHPNESVHQAYYS